MKNEKVEITNLFNQSRKEKKINIIKKSKHGGLIDCTIFARYFYYKYLDKNRMREMTGIFNKRKYNNKEEIEKDYSEEEDDENEEDKNDDCEENTEVKAYQKDNENKEDNNKFYKGRFIIIDVDTTSFKQKNC